MVDDPGFWGGDRNRSFRFGGRVRGWYRSGWGSVVVVWGSGFELFVESASPVLVETHAAAGASVALVA